MRDDAYEGVEVYELYITQGGAWGATRSKRAGCRILAGCMVQLQL